MEHAVNFFYLTLAQYQALESKNADTLYFVDNGVVYKGAVPFSQQVSKVATLPQNPIQGVIYVLDDYTAQFYNGSAWVTINVGSVTTIDDTAATNDAKVVTQGALKAYVAGKIASVFRFKGSLANLAAIEAVQNPVVGDVYHANDTGKEYVYVENEVSGETVGSWELLGFDISFEGYATETYVTNAISTATSNLIGTNADTSSSDTIKGAKKYTDALETSLKGSASDTASSETIAGAKKYADSLNSAMDTRMDAVEAAIVWQTVSAS